MVLHKCIIQVIPFPKENENHNIQSKHHSLSFSHKNILWRVEDSKNLKIKTKQQNFLTPTTTTFPQNSVRHPISQTVSYNPKLPETNSKEEIEYTNIVTVINQSYICAITKQYKNYSHHMYPIHKIHFFRILQNPTLLRLDHFLL